MPTQKDDKKAAKEKNIRRPDGPPEWIEGPQLPPEIVKKVQKKIKEREKGKK